MRIYKLKCPQCSEIVEYELDRDSMFCKYCAKQIFKNEITLDRVLSEKEEKKEEAQEYYEKWLELRKLNKTVRTSDTSKAFAAFDEKYNCKFPCDYRRLYCTAIELTNDFEGISTEEYPEEPAVLYDSEPHSGYREVCIKVGGQWSKDKLIRIENAILEYSSEKQALEMAKKIAEHIKLIESAEAQYIDFRGYHLPVIERLVGPNTEKYLEELRLYKKYVSSYHAETLWEKVKKWFNEE